MRKHYVCRTFYYNPNSNYLDSRGIINQESIILQSLILQINLGCVVDSAPSFALVELGGCQRAMHRRFASQGVRPRKFFLVCSTLVLGIKRYRFKNRGHSALALEVWCHDTKLNKLAPGDREANASTLKEATSQYQNSEGQRLKIKRLVPRRCRTNTMTLELVQNSLKDSSAKSHRAGEFDLGSFFQFCVLFF